MKPKKAGIYARISQDRRGEALGVQRQIADIEALALARGWVVAERYVDNDISASTRSTKVRPEYDRMRSDAEAGRIDGILVYSMDRLTRRMSELVAFIDWREKVGVPFMSTEGDDTETANGRMVIQIKGAVAQQESERIGERVKRSRDQSRAAGVPMGGGLRPFGWSDHSRTRIVQKEAKAIREGVRIILAGGTRGDWIRWMQARDIGTVRGGPWRVYSAACVLRSPPIAGLMRGPDGQLVPARGYKPIIGRDQWEAVQAVLGTVKPSGRGVVRVHLYSGLVFCGGCGARMVPQGKRWACVPHVAGGCNKVFRDLARVNAVVDGVIEGVLTATREPTRGRAKVESVDSLAVRLAAIDADMEDARTRWRNETLAREDFYAVQADLRAEANAIKGQQVTAVKAESRASSGSNLAGWRDVRPETLYARRAIAFEIVGRIVIHPVGKGIRGAEAVSSKGLDVVLRQR